MKSFIEALRFFFLSLEFLVFVAGGVIFTYFSGAVERIIRFVQVPDDFLKWVVAIPCALLVWSFVSGREVLFPNRDKRNILQQWPDYWRLRICFHVALTWNVIFLGIAVFAWLRNWDPPKADGIIALAVAILGAAICSLSIYNAQTRVEEATSRFGGPE